ncbi:glycosyltransferase, partial [Citrobacter sp. AAK_AS5]
EAERAGAVVVRHPFNLGIGAAVQTGLRFACEEGYDVVFRLDGDGQHAQADLVVLLAALRNNQVDAVFGSRFLGITSP